MLPATALVVVKSVFNSCKVDDEITAGLADCLCLVSFWLWPVDFEARMPDFAGNLAGWLLPLTLPVSFWSDTWLMFVV